MRKITTLFFAVLLAIVSQQCSDSDPEPKPIENDAKNLAARWADVTLHVVRWTFPNSPTFSSRNLGYIGLTMYESVVHGSASHQSVAAQLAITGTFPTPEPGMEYNWNLSLNAGQALILKSLYAHAFEDVMGMIDSLESVTYEDELAITDAETAERSVLFGRAVASAIFEWSKTDGGHEGHMAMFDFSYAVPVGGAYWTPPFFGQSASQLPLHPHWGNNRTFITANAALPVPAIASYSTLPTSAHYKYFEEVYQKRKQLTPEEKRIAAWWADDPTQTSSPPGHSYNLATIAVTSTESDIFTSAEAYAKVGLAVADAFICCWKIKYTYHSVRPFPYIIANIDPAYTQFWPEPPFPAFSSGHATQSAAAATALISIFGNDLPLADNTYDGRPSDFENIEYRTRTYANIWATAEECAYSRFLGGIHTRQDNETGTTQGIAIGQNVNALTWRK